jgi:hypothetical protein
MDISAKRVETAQLIDCLASTAPETFLDLLGKAPGGITARQAGYDLRRLRAHGLIARTPDTHHYRLTDTDPPMPTVLRTAARNYQRAWAAGTLENGTEKGADDGHIRQVQWEIRRGDADGRWIRGYARAEGRLGGTRSCGQRRGRPGDASGP